MWFWCQYYASTSSINHHASKCIVTLDEFVADCVNWPDARWFVPKRTVARGEWSFRLICSPVISLSVISARWSLPVNNVFRWLLREPKQALMLLSRLRYWEFMHRYCSAPSHIHYMVYKISRASKLVMISWIHAHQCGQHVEVALLCFRVGCDLSASNLPVAGGRCASDGERDNVVYRLWWWRVHTGGQSNRVKPSLEQQR